jgi:phospholipid transport system transporter-binding protein
LSRFVREGNRLRISGAVTVATVNALLEQCAVAFAADRGQGDLSGSPLEMDLSGVTEADSAAIALLFEWMRQARSQNASLIFTGLPDVLATLAALYGVLDLIPQRSH